MDPRIVKLVESLNEGRIGRRAFLTRAAALGLSAGFAGQLMRSAPAAAQDASPAAGGEDVVGNPAIPHITTTDKGSITLYSSWPFTGSMKQLGSDAIEASKMALEDLGNAAGGFALVYEPLDSGIAANNGGWDPGKESENANKAINDADCMAYLGTYNSGASKISIPITNGAGLSQISFGNTYPGLTKAIEGATEPGEPDIYYPSGVRNFMRTVPSDEIQGGAVANWAINQQGRKKTYTLHDNSLYGKGVALLYNESFKELGGESLGFEGYDPKATDYQSLMTKIADMGPDVLYVGATVENNPAKVLLDMRSLMPVDEVMFLGPDGLINQDFINGAGPDAEGAYVTFAGLPPSALKGIGADYAARMTERLGHTPDSYAAYAYEVMTVVVQAIDKAQEKDRAKILDAMFHTTDFHSLLGGVWHFTETGDTSSTTVSINRIEPDDSGKLIFNYLETIGSAS
ncbi:MAG: branched-chain amino acid ABC transporter substrate-binding protein [Thermomicrobiales bacterium]|nr:branched-chain amino acid ABC transporter substrate-binding protein [Thermomicrobiales bacterium]